MLICVQMARSQQKLGLLYKVFFYQRLRGSLGCKNSIFRSINREKTVNKITQRIYTMKVFKVFIIKPLH